MGSQNQKLRKRWLTKSASMLQKSTWPPTLCWMPVFRLSPLPNWLTSRSPEIASAHQADQLLLEDQLLQHHLDAVTALQWLTAANHQSPSSTVDKNLTIRIYKICI